MQSARFTCAFGLLAAALVGCGSSGSEASPAVTVTTTVTATVTASPNSEPTNNESADVRAGLFAEGYPKVIDISEVPERMQGSLEGDKAVEIAPQVFTDYIEGIDPVDLAVDGAPIGLCAAVEKWQRELSAAGYSPGGSTCW